MNDELLPAIDTERPLSPDDGDRQPWIQYLLATLWIVLPALQYAGAYQRTLAVTERGESVGALGMADLLPWYIALVGATAIYLLSRAVIQKQLQRTTDGEQE